VATCTLAVLISGSGSNLKALIDAIDSGRLDARIVLVISNRIDAGGLDHAARAGIDTAVIDHRDYSDRHGFDTELMRRLDAVHPDLVVLAGFMRILTTELITHYADRIINIHPSLLPKYKGLDTHRRALEAGDRVHGASVHFVVPELDSGAVVVQAVVEVRDDDDADSLAARVLEQEHVIYPLAIGWFANGRLDCHNGELSLDGKPLTRPLQWQHDRLLDS
jgi:phosphoribosylglycinamide formyltransferase-1